MEFSNELVDRINKLADTFPNKKGALLPVLYLVQKECGFLSENILKEIALILNIPEVFVFGVTTFYTMFHTSEQAKKRKAVRPVRAEMELGEGVELASGKPRIELGHLEGRSNKMEPDVLWGMSPTDNRARAEWVVHGKPGDTVTTHVLSERAGSLHKTIVLP